jgi:hypothetical protein
MALTDTQVRALKSKPGKRYSKADIELYAPADSYGQEAEIYRLDDPNAATKKMRKDDLSAWRQKGHGRVVL